MLKFNEFGYLATPGPVIMDIESFIGVFVVNTHRESIFDNFKEMLEELKSILPLGPFYLWINGSYVSKRANPKDLDVIAFVNFKVYSNSENIFRDLRRKYAKIDLYFVKNYPEDHPKRFITEFDQIEWNHLFSTDRLKRKKGFVQLNF